MDNQLSPSRTISKTSKQSRYAQLLLIIIIAAAFAIQGTEYFVAAIYGGGISLVLSWTLSWAMEKATEVSQSSVKKGMVIAYVSAVIRFVLLLALLAIGIGLLKLQAIPVVVTTILAWLVGIITPLIFKEQK